ncbi:uncharacterized protein [Watersipora subatra]|uniref:uncharacterized protein n=1 Tax=Watersipora subatra TaxID=2589382 RepID=UPI00355C37A3
MVQKKNKKGRYTGNTIRNYSSNSTVRQYQKYSCLVVNSDVGNDSSNARNAVAEVSSYIPSNPYQRVELSLNKRRRWELPEQFKSKIEEEQDNPDVKITLMEHTLMPSTDTISYRWETCDSYYSNKGKVRKSVSKKEMSVRSVTQGHRLEDHLSKAERRKRKKMKNMDNATEDLADSLLPSYECHVIYGAPTDGRLLKNSFTKGLFKCKEKGHNDTTGCGKRFLSRPVYSDDEMFPYSDDDGHAAETHENSLSLPITASLADLISTSTCQKRHRTRKCSGESTDSGNSSCSGISSDSSTESDKKAKIIFIDQPVVPIVSSTRTQASTGSTLINPFIPEYSDILIKSNDVDMATLLLNFGDKYREAYSTPRIFTIDLSADLEATARNERLYMVMVLRAEGMKYDKYRLFCTGSCIDVESTKVRNIKEDNIYDLITLKSIVLSHWTNVGAKRKSNATCSFRLLKKSIQRGEVSWNVSSANLSEIAQQTVSDQHKPTEFNLKNYQNGKNELLYIPTQLQRSMSCALQCGICFEELNDKALHSALLSCHHYFCNDCWSVHLITAVKSGLVHITCPEYECKKEVDSVFLMSMLEFSTYCLHEMHVAEYSLFRTKQAVWCPTKGCGRVLHCGDELAEKDEPITASCACGTKCCFRCLKEPHWPLTCDQANKYKEKLKKDGIEKIDRFEASMLVVSTKRCPKCQTIMEKDGGCVLMVCFKCNTAFCWKCCKPYTGTQYLHDCKGQEMVAETKEFSHCPSDRRSHFYKEACFHRLYKSGYKQTELHSSVRKFLSTIKHGLRFQSAGGVQSLRRYMNQVLQQILATHDLLEYCSATNLYKKGPKYCTPAISSLSYSVGVLERLLVGAVCNQAAVDKITKYYDTVKSNTLLLVRNMSQVLSYTEPTVCQ